jgi:bifunctional non-homologous end joining protein LigD
MALEEYRRKRDFHITPEPRGGKLGRSTGRRFVVQKHAARRLHYDFRLELDGVLLSWAVPKGPSLVAGDRRMAVQTEDHPIEYGDFEGVIPKKEYGGGTVVLWDRGHWEPIGDARKDLKKGKLTFRLAGEKLRGRWHLVRTRANNGKKASWLLIKARDEEAKEAGAPAITDAEPKSVLTGRGLDEVERDADRVWSSHDGERDAPKIAEPGDPSALTDAKKSRMPRTLEPQLATLVDAVPSGEEWLHELKLDGYRLLCRLDGSKVQLLTRAGNDWTDRFPTLAEALAGLPARSALFDGEAVVLDAQGRSDFQALQRSFGQERRDLHLFAFDLLYLDGYDLRHAPLVERKRLLQQLLARAPEGGTLRYSDHVQGQGSAFMDVACRSGAEGIVSKRADAPYVSKRTRTWLKIKCSKRQEFVIVGFTDPAGSRTGIGALLLGARDEEGALRYAGKVGTGFDTSTLQMLHRKLEPLEIPKTAVVGAPRARGQHWVRPELVAEVRFAEWTRDGKVRHSTFMGLREDKDAEEVRLEQEQPVVVVGPPAVRDEVAGVRLSTPDRVYFPESGVTKSELAQYYERVADRMLPTIVQRPLSMVRCPESREECFYQKRADRTIPKRVGRVVVKKGREPYAMVEDLASLISLVQVGVLEFHVWGARADKLDRPDLLIFDLDPDPTVEWRMIADTAKVLRNLLDEIGLAAFVRTTGGKGLHVVTPLQRRSTWEEVKGFAHAIALHLVAAAPDRFTAKMTKAKRHGKIFIDTFRNDPESTAIASWSARAREGAPVAAPLAWEELEADARPVITVRDVGTRLAMPDPWADFEASRRALTKKAIDRVTRKSAKSA